MHTVTIKRVKAGVTHLSRKPTSRGLQCDIAVIFWAKPKRGAMQQSISDIAEHVLKVEAEWSPPTPARRYYYSSYRGKS